MPRNIFISYRREENRYQARMIFDAFQKAKVRVFYDIDSISPGRNFKEIIMAQVQKCDVMLALVGPNWATCLDPKTKLRRLENADDFVRIEIGTALNRGIPVVPVLLDDASLPETDQLPNDLRNLFDMQAEFVSFRTFDDDVKRLITKLKIKSPQKLESPELTSTVQPGQPPLRDRAAGYRFMGEVPIVASPQTQIKDLFDSILKYTSHYLLTFARLFSGPKKFIARQQLDSETERNNVLVFLAISTVLSSVVMVWAAPSEKKVFWSALGKDLVLNLVFVVLGGVVIRFSWWVVGGKAAARSLFVLSTYLISVLTCIVSDVAILAVWWMNPATPPADLLTPAAMLFAAIIWAVCFWGAFRSLTGSSKLRSFFAFMIWATLFIPLFWLIIPARLLGPG